jgi:elongation factor G
MPPVVVEIALQPVTRADRDKLELALKRLIAEDASLRVTTDRESGQTIIGGTTDVQLEGLIECLKREFKVEANVGAPQVAYRESLAKPVEVDYTHKKHLGPMYQFGRVKVQVAPGERGSGVQFFDEIKDDNIPREYIPWVEKGMRESAQAGWLLGFPIIDFEIHLIDGAYHDTDSSPVAFEMAGRGAMREAAQKAGIVLLEPIMKVEVAMPEEFVGDLIGVLNGRRGQIEHTESRDAMQVVVATAPMANLFGFEKAQSDLSGGRAVVDISWERYAPVPPSDFSPDDNFPAAAALRA